MQPEVAKRLGPNPSFPSLDAKAKAKKMSLGTGSRLVGTWRNGGWCPGWSQASSDSTGSRDRW